MPGTGWVAGEREILVNSTMFQLCKRSPTGIIHSMVTIVNSGVIYGKFAKRLNLRCSYHQRNVNYVR